MFYEGYILTARGSDEDGIHKLHYFGIDKDGSFEIIIDNQKPVFFIERSAKLPNNLSCERKSVKLSSFSGENVDALYFSSIRDLYNARDQLKQIGIRTFEADILPVERFLMENLINVSIDFKGEITKSSKGLRQFINPQVKGGSFQPSFSSLSLDIETGINNELYSIGIHYVGKNKEVKKVFMVGDEKENKDYLYLFENEKQVYRAFVKEFYKLDPDFIYGWHVAGFDLKFLAEKCHKWGENFILGRGGGIVGFVERTNMGMLAKIDGRVVIDGPNTLRSSFFTFEDYRLQTVASEVLGVGKDIEGSNGDKIEEIARRFNEDKYALAKYNLLDCTLVTDIYKKLSIIDILYNRSIISGMTINRIGISTASFDHFFVPKLHRKGYVAANVTDIQKDFAAAGGYVMEPITGMNEHVIVMDFKSLYPTIIKTFNIDPYSLLKSKVNPLLTPAGIEFSRTEHILPEFIDQLMEKRKSVKDKDENLSQAIKILMNSLYGVMGSGRSRFYNSSLPTSITKTGHWILKELKTYFDDIGYEIIYGDTDSIFLKLKLSDRTEVFKRSRQLVSQANDYLRKIIKRQFSVDSQLDLEFEDYYRKIFIPTVRAGTRGAKKRYVGLMQSESGEESLKFIGMEFVRSDWTKMAKEFQYEIFKRLFYDGDIEVWLKKFVDKFREGEFNDKLYYKKRLSKQVNEYVKNIPPHVKAAKKLEEAGINIPNYVRYVITQRGPVPIELEHKDIDYEHYIERQIKPLADSILSVRGESFDNFFESQLSLF